MMNWMLLTYTLYLAVSVVLTVWVAQTLGRHGRVFLVRCFHGNEELGDSVNQLLKVGFYLVNLGFIALFLQVRAGVDTPQQVFEVLSYQLGVVLLVLGAMHFFNLVVLAKLSTAKRGVPPLPNAQG
jgi:hypothetical protein